MRKLYLLALSLSVLSAAAVTVDVPRLSGPSYADREVSGDVALPENRLEKMRVFRLEMTFDATASNNVQVAFGHDTMPADGALSAEETAYIETAGTGLKRLTARVSALRNSRGSGRGR